VLRRSPTVPLTLRCSLLAPVPSRAPHPNLALAVCRIACQAELWLGLVVVVLLVAGFHPDDQNRLPPSFLCSMLQIYVLSVSDVFRVML